MKTTKEGRKFLLASALIAVAALNTGNNLIYLILGMMLSVIAVSVIALKANMRGLSLDVTSTGYLYAGREGVLGLTVHNSKKTLPSYSLKIGFPPGISGEAIVPRVGTLSSFGVEASVRFGKRGAYVLDGFSIESGFPFIFFTKKIKAAPPRDKKTGAEVVVYPEVRELTGLSELLLGGDESMRRGRADADELLLIRDFRYGDDTHRINWKASARADRLMVMESASLEPRTISIILDNGGPLSAEAFERAVSFAASAAGKFVREGFYVRLMTCDGASAFGDTEEHLRRLLYALAVIQEKSGKSGCPSPPELEGACILILKSRGSASASIAHECEVVIYAEEL